MVMLVDDAQGQMQGVLRQPRGDFFRPLDCETKRAREKIVEHQRVDLPIILQSVSVEVYECARAAAMQCENIEGRARDGVGHAKAFGESLHERGFAHAEIAVERDGGIDWQRLREAKRDGLRLFGGASGHACGQFSEDAHNREIY